MVLSDDDRRRFEELAAQFEIGGRDRRADWLLARTDRLGGWLQRWWLPLTLAVGGFLLAVMGPDVLVVVGLAMIPLGWIVMAVMSRRRSG